MFGQGGSRDVINKIIRFYFDAKEDYRLAAKRAPSEECRSTLDSLVDEREAFHKHLQEAVTHHGIEMSDNGTTAADLKRDWERVRGSVAGNGFEAAMKLADQSDAHALEQIGILTARDLPADLREILDNQSDALRSARTRCHDICRTG